MALSSILEMWRKWNIRGFIILSLLLQVFLILFAPLRKKVANRHIVFLLWLAYLMADWVVVFTIGLISHTQVISKASATEVDGALLAFWVSFLLLHLGGPDTITAFSLEDNSLWGRHLLSLISQVIGVISVFVQIFLSDKSLVIPTILVFLAAVLKNAERTLALNLSNLPKLKETILSHHSYYNVAVDKLREEFNPPEDGGFDKEEAKLPESTVVKHAYFFFQLFKAFLADLMFTGEQRITSRAYFNRISAMDALRVISVELQFIYEVLNTKVLVIRSKRSYIFRFITFTSVGMAFILFNRLNKDRLPKLDVEITYSILYGGIALDVIALLMLVFSDWTVVEIMCYKKGSSRLRSCLHKLVLTTDDLRKPRFTTYKGEPKANVTYDVLETRLIFRRWSESIFACNLFSETFKESPRKKNKPNWCSSIITFYKICSFPFWKPKKMISCFHRVAEKIVTNCCLRNPRAKILMMKNMKYVSKNPFVKKLWVFIYEELRGKSRDANDLTKVRDIFGARGDLFLRSPPEGINCDALLSYVTKVNYDASIITWHLATEICYSREERSMSPTSRTDEREFSKILSDYMLYLLLNRSDVMSTVRGIANMRSEETLYELKFRKNTEKTTDVEELCNSLINSFEGRYKTGLMNSALCDGTMLAIEMEKLGEMKWKVVSKVWVEMLSYAAVHIKGEVHVQVLSKGGELLTFVWVLMAHFGLLYTPEWGLSYGSPYREIVEVIQPEIKNRTDRFGPRDGVSRK